MKTRVKICGITRMEDALAAAQSGSDYLGYVFYAPSKRFVAPRTASVIIKEVRNQFPAVEHVGVFVDETAENLVWTRNLAGLDYAQLHGHESPDYCAELAGLGIDVIKALGFAAEGARSDYRQYDVPFFLCDTYDENSKGGTGRTFSHNLIPEGLPLERTFLAGGLNGKNILKILQEIHPYAVDVSSGVEEAAGIKSHAKLQEFIRQVTDLNANAISS